MKVLVTGATGFVGRVVARLFASRGHSVRVALRAPHPELPFESVVIGDLANNTDWNRALAGVNAVIHLAARVHVMRDYADGAAEFRRVNTEGTLRLARAAAAAGARRFVFVSSIKVNGEATTGRPFRADDEPHPGDAYARSKYAAERGLLEIGGIEPVTIRPPLVHGPGAKGNLARFCRLARSGWPVPLGGISNRRDLVGVENLANLIERCIWHPAAAGQVFLASDGHALSTPELYGLIAEALDRPARMVKVPVTLMRALAGPLGFGAEIDRLTQSLELDITRTRELLGWEPPVSAAAGIADMARAFASRSS
jgi:nucleoside-diphosphate-sugar epimerase